MNEHKRKPSLRYPLFVLIMTIAIGVFFGIRNRLLRKHLRELQQSSYVFNADELAKMSRENKPDVVVVKNDKVGEWDKKGAKIKLELVPELTIGKEEGDENEVFSMIPAEAVDSKGNIYILDLFNCRVQKFDSAGTYLQTIGNRGKGPGEFLRPMAMTIDRFDNLYVADEGNNRISKFDSLGNFITSFMLRFVGSPIRSLKIDSKGNLYLTYFNPQNRKLIHKYSPEGEYLLSFCDSYAKGKNVHISVEQFYAGGVIDIDTADVIYFTQFAPYEIRKFSTDGELLCRILRKNTFLPPPPDIKVKEGQPLTLRAFSAFSSSIIILDDNKFINVVLKISPGKPVETIVDLFDISGKLLLSRHLKKKTITYRDNRGKIYGGSGKPYPHLTRYRFSLKQEI